MLDSLKRGVCHLWHWRPVGFSGTLAWLSDDEKARYHRYRFRPAAETFLAARVLLRGILSAYWPGIPPDGWRFRFNEWGRPEIDALGDLPPLRFNLTHKPGYVACLIGLGRDLGVDVEDTSVDRPHLLALASRFFSPVEAEGLRALIPEARLRRFYELWTLKESYIKARGMGLSLGLSRFSFFVNAGVVNHPAIRAEFDPSIENTPGRWEFRLFEPDSRYLIAAAVERAGLAAGIETRDVGRYLVSRELGW